MIRKFKNRVLPKGVLVERGYVYLRLRHKGKALPKQCFGKATNQSVDRAISEMHRSRERLGSGGAQTDDQKQVRWPFPYACDEFIKHRPQWRYYRSQLCSFFGKYFFDELTFVKIEKYRPFRTQQGIADSTVNREITMIGAMYNLFRRLRNVKEIPNVALPVENPCLGINKVDEGPNRRRRIISPEEFQIIMSEASPRLKRAILAAFNTGLRRKDVYALDAEGNDKHSNLLEGVMHKVGAMYRIDRNDVMSALYETAIDGRVVDSTNHKREFLQLRSVCVNKHKMEDFIFKDFRRSAAWQVWLSERNILAVMAFLQHKRVTTTQNYLGISSSDVKRAVDVLQTKFSFQIENAQKMPKEAKVSAVKQTQVVDN